MYVLAIDTSTPTITAAVADLVLSTQPETSGPADPVTVCAQQQFHGAFSHAEMLMPQVSAALIEAGLTLAQLDAIVVGLGPGPYTGLRVGIATAQALGLGLDIPVFGVCSHDGMAGCCADTGPLLVVTDARRREVYVSAYDGGHRVAGPTVLTPAALTAWVAEHLPDGVLAVTGAGTDLAGLAAPVRQPSAPLGAGLVRAALGALASGRQPGALAPLYLRRPDATEPGQTKRVCS